MTSNFPRGWSQTNLGSGVLSVITLPAVAGIVHVLDSFYARIETGGTAFTPNVTFVSGGLTVQLATLDVPAVSGSVDSDSGDFQIAGVLGAALQVTFSSTAAGIVEFLRITGHDI